MKKQDFVNLIFSTRGQKADEVENVLKLMEKETKRLGVGVKDFAPFTPFLICRHIANNVHHLADLQLTSGIKLPLENDGLAFDKYDFVLIPEHSPLRQLLEQLQNETGKSNSTVVIDHHQYRIVNRVFEGRSKAQDDLKINEEVDFHLYQVDVEFMQRASHSRFEGFLNFIRGTRTA